MSVGVLYVEWLDEFELSLGDTALIGSIATGSVLLMGMLSVIIKYIACLMFICQKTKYFLEGWLFPAYQSFLNCSDWLDKSRPYKNFFGQVNRLNYLL